MSRSDAIAIAARLMAAAFFFSAAPVQAGLTSAQISEALESAEPTRQPITWTAPQGEWSLSSPADTKDGVDGLRTPALAMGGFQTLSGTVHGPGVLRGWVRSSTELHHDGLSISVDGGGTRTFSGMATQEFELPVPNGERQITITFFKDGTISEGADSVWLDAVQVTRSTVTAMEGLDLAGTPAAALVTLSAPGGTLDGVLSVTARALHIASGVPLR